MGDADKHECPYNEATLRYVTVFFRFCVFIPSAIPLWLYAKAQSCKIGYNIHTPGYWKRTPISYHALIFFIIVSGVGPLGTAATTGLLYQPQMIDDGDCGEIGGMKIGRGNRSSRRKPAPAPLCPPQIPHDQTRARIRAAAMGSQRLTAWAKPVWRRGRIPPPWPFKS
jgi:hypothetical protein